MPRDEWSRLPRPGVVGVHGRVLVTGADLVVAMLRFAPRASIDEHDAQHEIEVVCLEGSGLTSVDGEAAPIHAGQTVTWPAGKLHGLWTEGISMITLMIEHPSPIGPSGRLEGVAAEAEDSLAGGHLAGQVLAVGDDEHADREAQRVLGHADQ